MKSYELRVVASLIIIIGGIMGVVALADVAYTMVNGFNAGELTPQLDGRTDLDKYYKGCSTLSNMSILPYGGVTKRPGSYYIANAKYSATRAELIPFEFSVDESYVMEFGNLYARFFTDGGAIVDVNSDPIEVVTPYLAQDVNDLRYVQSANFMYFAHSDYPPAKLTRTAADSWTFTETEFDRGPFLDENTTITTITPSALTGDVNLVSSTPIFDANHVGSHWQITHIIDSNVVDFSLADDLPPASTSSVFVQKNRDFSWLFTNSWTGTVTLQRSYDGEATWEEVTTVTAAGTPPPYEGTELVNDAYYRAYRESGLGSDMTSSFTAKTFSQEGVVEIDTFVDVNNVSGTAIHSLGKTAATVKWSEGAFSEYRGWPKCISLFQNRVIYAGTEFQPQTVFMSVSDQWENMRIGADDGDAAIFTIAADKINPIQWMASLRYLVIGTSGGEWILTGGGQTAVTPTSIDVRLESNLGSESIQGIMVNNLLMYVQRGGRKLREMPYDFASDSYDARDLTLLSEHLTRGGICDIDYAKTPDSVVAVTLENGGVLNLTYKPDQQVFGWAKMDYGNVESLCVIPGTSESEIWLTVNRTIDSNTVRYIEQVQTRDWGDDQQDAYYVDSGLSFDGGDPAALTDITSADPGVVTSVGHGYIDGAQITLSGVVGMTQVNLKSFAVELIDVNSFSLRDPADVFDWDTTTYSDYSSGGLITGVAKSFTTLTHLEGETVVMVGDGSYAGTATVSGGAVTLMAYFNTVHVGLPYTSQLRTMRLNIPGSDGSVQGAAQRIISCRIRLYQSLGVQIGPTFDDLIDIEFRETGDTLNVATPLYSGDKTELFMTSYQEQSYICVQSEKPLPMTVLALMPEWDINR